MALCSSCAKLDISRLRMETFRAPVAYNLDVVQDAAQKGCSFCLLLWETACSMRASHEAKKKPGAKEKRGFLENHTAGFDSRRPETARTGGVRCTTGCTLSSAETSSGPAAKSE